VQAHGDRSPLRELHRIPDQVDQDLAQPGMGTRAELPNGATWAAGDTAGRVPLTLWVEPTPQEASIWSD
jgi:hypothetical protein